MLGMKRIKLKICITITVALIDELKLISYPVKIKIVNRVKIGALIKNVEVSKREFTQRNKQ